MTSRPSVVTGVLVLGIAGVVFLLMGPGTRSDGAWVPPETPPRLAQGESPAVSALSPERVTVEKPDHASGAMALSEGSPQGEGGPDASEDGGPSRHRAPEEELESLGLELLNEVLLVEKADGLSSVSNVRLQEWGSRAWDVHGKLVHLAFDDLMARGSVEVFPMREPSSAKLNALYDCAYSWTAGEPDESGIERVEVCVYPRHEYPMLNELKDLKARLDAVRHSR